MSGAGKEVSWVLLRFPETFENYREPTHGFC